MAITTTTHDLSLDKALTNMLSSARNLAEKTEREDGDWQVLNATRSVSREVESPTSSLAG